MGEPGDGAATRAELELALRAAHLSIAELREDLHALAAQVVALTEQVTAGQGQQDAQEAQGGPSEPGAMPTAGDRAARLEARTDELRHELALAEARSSDRLLLAAPDDKYAISGEGGPPCAELLPICGARCCRFEISLSTQDLDEGVLRWSYATPYALAKADDGQCLHHRDSACEVYQVRPATCRHYDCRGDTRVWADYERRVLATEPLPPSAPPTRQALEADARKKQQAMFVEVSRLRRRHRGP